MVLLRSQWGALALGMPFYLTAPFQALFLQIKVGPYFSLPSDVYHCIAAV